MSRSLSDYLELTPRAAADQWRAIRSRHQPSPSVHQEDYVPVETLLCAAAMLVVGGRSHGGSSAGREPTPVPELAQLFRRRVSSIPSKMANLDGTRPKGGRHDHAVWLALNADQARLGHLYQVVLAAARSTGIGPDTLPDFLGIEHGGTIHLLGQYEISESVLDELLQSEIDAFILEGTVQLDRPTERDIITTARIGQHRFARGVLDNCGRQCVFCGFHLDGDDGSGLLRASHIKPWRDSDAGERLDIRNGVAACPTHDSAFDAGLLTFDSDLGVRVSARLRTSTNPALRTYFDPPVLRREIVLGVSARGPRIDYVAWHGLRVFLG